MSTKAEILTFLENNRGTYFSGEEIADKLSVSRTAVWKAVNVLKSEGYEIDAVRNRGYCLSENTDILSEQGIRKYLSGAGLHTFINVLQTVDSTNNYLKKLAGSGAPDGTCAIAANQTGGKGRIGRSFFSPYDTGVYLSILVRPKMFTAEQSVRITTMAAVAACEAIECTSGKNAEIKWVNDVYVDGRKVAGILTEGAFGLEDNTLEYAVMGIGFNVYVPDGGFPDEIKDRAGAIFETRVVDIRNRLSAEFINRFMSYYENGFAGYVEKYKARSFVLGENIDVYFRGSVTKAQAIDIDNECGLIVRYEDGRTETLTSGEISVRLEGQKL